MSFNKVSIIGLGLIGGSLATALKRSGEVEEVVGFDIDKPSIKYALDNAIIDSGFTSIGEELKNSAVVVVATYVDLIPHIVKEIVGFLSDSAVIIDVGSVKSTVIKEIDADISFVGCHPIAGTENSGVMNSDPNLFKGKICFITPTEKTDGEKLSKVERFWQVVGSRVEITTPETHDFIFANVSHLPHVVAYALINAVSSAETDLNLFNFAGGGLNDFTRIAESSAEMWASIFLSNREHLLASLNHFKDKVVEIESAVSNNQREQLIKILSESRLIKRGIKKD